MRVAEAIGRALGADGVRDVFGLMGSGNLTVTNALRAGGARVHLARHETGAVAMADAYARVSGRVGVATVHQGPGLTNAVTALTEAAKSRTPLLLLAADVSAGAARSNFRIDQAGLVQAVGAESVRLEDPATAVRDALRARRRAEAQRRTIVLSLPLDVQAAEAAAGDGPEPPEPARAEAPEPAAEAVEALAELLGGARRPVLLAGRGAVLAGAGEPLRRLAGRTGARLATTAVANGLFGRDSRCLGISGGFASPHAAELLRGADVLVAFGAALNDWTTRRGELLGPGARLAQVDVEPDAIGAHRPVDLGVAPDPARTARALLDALPDRADGDAVEPVRAWRDEPFAAAGAPGVVDPRALSLAADELLPAERTVVVDSGHFMGWPAMYLEVPDAQGFVFAQAFQSVGLGLANAIGAAVARPDRVTVAAVGDGGLLMALGELETLARLGLPVCVLVYDDEAYGAEVHHFRGLGQPVDLARFPPADLAALGDAAGCRALCVRDLSDLEPLRAWGREPDGPIVVDAKVDPEVCAAWLEDAFRGH